MFVYDKFKKWLKDDIWKKEILASAIIFQNCPTKLLA